MKTFISFSFFCCSLYVSAQSKTDAIQAHVDARSYDASLAGLNEIEKEAKAVSSVTQYLRLITLLRIAELPEAPDYDKLKQALTLAEKYTAKYAAADPFRTAKTKALIVRIKAAYPDQKSFNNHFAAIREAESIRREKERFRSQQKERLRNYITEFGFSAVRTFAEQSKSDLFKELLKKTDISETGDLTFVTKKTSALSAKLPKGIWMLSYNNKSGRLGLLWLVLYDGKKYGKEMSAAFEKLKTEARDFGEDAEFSNSKILVKLPDSKILYRVVYEEGSSLRIEFEGLDEL